jgi:hypothetical protein
LIFLEKWLYCKNKVRKGIHMKKLLIIGLLLVSNISFAQQLLITTTTVNKCHHFSEDEAKRLSQNQLEKQACVYKTASKWQNQWSENALQSNLINRERISADFKEASKSCKTEFEDLKKYLESIWQVTELSCK